MQVRPVHEPAEEGESLLKLAPGAAALDVVAIQDIDDGHDVFVTGVVGPGIRGLLHAWMPLRFW